MHIPGIHPGGVSGADDWAEADTRGAGYLAAAVNAAFVSHVTPLSPLLQRDGPHPETPLAEECGLDGVEATVCIHPRRGMPELCLGLALGSYFPFHQVTSHLETWSCPCGLFPCCWHLSAGKEAASKARARILCV